MRQAEYAPMVPFCASHNEWSSETQAREPPPTTVEHQQSMRQDQGRMVPAPTKLPRLRWRPVEGGWAPERAQQAKAAGRRR